MAVFIMAETSTLRLRSLRVLAPIKPVITSGSISKSWFTLRNTRVESIIIVKRASTGHGSPAAAAATASGVPGSGSVLSAAAGVSLTAG